MAPLKFSSVRDQLAKLSAADVFFESANDDEVDFLGLKIRQDRHTTENTGTFENYKGFYPDCTL